MNHGHQLLVHDDPKPRGGPWNMACDEAVLLDSLEHGRCHLRFYRWAEPTLSLGYFQPSTERTADPLLATLPAVRRLSGGGAIVHDRELTYSCSVPATHPISREPLQLYDVVHKAFAEALARLGIKANLRGEFRPTGEEHYLCFSRRDRRDLVVEGRKVLGSAQRRRRGAVLQHGSLLLERSQFAPQLEGLRELVGRDVDARFVERVTSGVADRLASRDCRRGAPISPSRELLSKYEELDCDAWRRPRRPIVATTNPTASPIRLVDTPESSC